MLYEFHELGRQIASPMVQLSESCAMLLNHPSFPLSALPPAHLSFVRSFAAGCELVCRLGKSYEKPAYGLGAVQVGGRTLQVEEETVWEKPFCRLLHFRKRWAGIPWQRRTQPAVLLVAPLSGHHASLLRDTLAELLKDHDVYLTDWTDARIVPAAAGPFGLGDYVGYVRDFIRLLGPDIHVVAVCQSTVPVLGAVALMASAGERRLPASMTMMGGPIDTRHSPTQVNRFATSKPLSWFRSAMIYPVPQGHPGSGRRVYPGFVQHACFVSMNARRHAESFLDFYRQRCSGGRAERHCAFYDEYNATLDMTEEFYLETIQAVFQERWLARGIWTIGGMAVRPQDIGTVALLTIEGDRDDIAGPGQTEAAHGLCSGIPAPKKRHFVVPDSGHYCIFSGHRWRDTVYPQVRDFIQAHAHQEAASQAPQARETPATSPRPAAVAEPA